MRTPVRYFDHNATAPVRLEVVEAMARVQRDGPGNPSSMHERGRRARARIDEARDRIAALLSTRARNVVFTSGASEANNLALRGYVARGGTTIVTSAVEHASILATAAALERAGTRVVRLPVDAHGDLAPGALAEHCRSGPCLAALGWANGESGQIRDVTNLLGESAADTVLHVDAAQAVGRVPVLMHEGIDMLSFSAHKFGGPQGIGALVAVGDCIEPLVSGGAQEHGLRAGTENVAAIVGLGVAAELAADEMTAEAARLTSLREALWERLHRALPNLLRISPADGLPGTLTIASADTGGDVIVAGLDLAGFCVSTGSACAAGAPEPSHVMRALGVVEPYLSGVVRISMGRENDRADIDALAQAFVRVVLRAREAA